MGIDITLSPMITNSPAKLIISGEHSVLYTQVAVTCAIDRFLQCATTDKQTNIQKKIPLLAHCLDSFFDYFKLPSDEIKLKIHSSIPTHSGLGSSAALIVSTLLYLHRRYNLPVMEHEFLHLAQTIENFQHGRSSGIDIKTVFYGGICVFREKQTLALKPDKQFLQDIVMIHSGKSKFATKDVVSYVKQHFSHDKSLWNEFYTVGVGIHQSIEKGNHNLFSTLIDENHKLLMRIGVVSERVATMIQELKSLGIHSKVCGAGTIGLKDPGCGYIGIFHPIEEDVFPLLHALAFKYNYPIEKVKISKNGSQYITP